MIALQGFVTPLETKIYMYSVKSLSMKNFIPMVVSYLKTKSTFLLSTLTKQWLVKKTAGIKNWLLSKMMGYYGRYIML